MKKPLTLFEVINALQAFHRDVDLMCAVAGCHGEISARDDRVLAVMDRLYEIDKLLERTQYTHDYLLPT